MRDIIIDHVFASRGIEVTNPVVSSFVLPYFLALSTYNKYTCVPIIVWAWKTTVIVSSIQFNHRQKTGYNITTVDIQYKM